jgi:hypothetical protein
MQVQFDATIDDFVDVTLRSVAGSKALRAWRWEGAITFASLIGLSMYLILPGSTVAKLVAGVLAFVFIIFVSLATYKNSCQKRVRKRAFESQESKDQFIEFAKKYLQPDSQILTNG